MTRVVNMKLDPYDVYIGRANPSRNLAGPFGNPVVIGRSCPECGKVHDRDGSIRCFQVYFYRRIVKDQKFLERVLQLKGKVLGCFCASEGGITTEDEPWVCHGQVIADFLDNENN